MVTRLCDRCGQLIEEGNLRFIVKIQVYAAYDPLKITFEDLLRRDFKTEIKQITEQCKDLTEEDLMRDIYTDFEFDLCRRCQRDYIKDPFPPVDRP